MKESSDKIQSEFEQKLRQNDSVKSNPNIVANDPDTVANQSARTPDMQDSNARANNQNQVIPVIEEQVRIDKKTVETGSVHVSKDVHEEQVTVDVPTVQEEVSVDRVAINEYVDSPPQVRHEGDVMIIPVLQEELVVVKRLKLVEEIHVTKRRHETHENQHITLRKEEVRINRVDPDGENPNRV